MVQSNIKTFDILSTIFRSIIFRNKHNRMVTDNVMSCLSCAINNIQITSGNVVRYRNLTYLSAE